VVKKHKVELAEDLIDIVKCNNPKCISNNEPMHTHFHVVDADKHILRCHYCERIVNSDEVALI